MHRRRCRRRRRRRRRCRRAFSTFELSVTIARHLPQLQHASNQALLVLLGLHFVKGRNGVLQNSGHRVKRQVAVCQPSWGCIAPKRRHAAEIVHCL